MLNVLWAFIVIYYFFKEVFHKFKIILLAKRQFNYSDSIKGTQHDTVLQ